MSENPQNVEEAEELEEELPKVESSEDLARIIQAIVFASPDIVTLKKLREILGDFLDARTVSDALIAANDSLNKINSPFEIVASNAQGDNQGNLNEILMFGSGSQLGYSKNPRTLKCFRCHFYVNADGSELEQGGSSGRNFVLNFGDDEATGVVPIDNGQWIMDNEADAWYTLDGRRLSGKPTQKGLYIHNGNKVAIK